jgi:anti-sigma-K factor RskA
VEPKRATAGDAELRDLLGAYALGAVDAREAEAVQAFVGSDALAAEELAELMAAVDALAMSVEPMAPPAGLRGRIAEAIRADDAIEPPAPAIAPYQPPAAVPGPQPASRPAPTPIRPEAKTPFWQRPAPWAAAAAALLLLTLGLLFWNLQLQSQITSVPTPEIVALAPDPNLAPGASGEVHYSPQQQLFLVDVRDLPPLPEGYVYEVWLINDEGAAPAGVFDQSTDQHAIVADRAQYNLLAITVEPGPLGTEVATGEIVAKAPL